MANEKERKRNQRVKEGRKEEQKPAEIADKKEEKIEQEKKINEWEVLPIGDDGNWAIRIQLFDQNKQGIKGEIVFTEVSIPMTLASILPIVSVPAAQNPPTSGINPLVNRELKQSTDDAGYLKIVLNPFQERERCIHVDYVKTGWDIFMTLKGPKQQKPRAKFDPKAGLLANLTQSFPQQPVQQPTQQKHLLRRRK